MAPQNLRSYHSPEAKPEIAERRSSSHQDEPMEPIWRRDILHSIEKTIDGLSNELRQLSLDIHEHPEVMFKEYHAHDTLVAFMSRHGFKVTKQYILQTGWRAEWSRGSSGRTIGVNSEMDALPGIGHACGHNLIAMAGVAVSLAIKAVFEKYQIDGKIVLLGTPAEEGGAGKVIMFKEGAYDGMAACLMCHPAPGPLHSVSLSKSLALRRIEVAYIGHSAHAALSPWEGTNAQDAAVLAYNNISALRQQIRPTHRVHGIIQGNEWATNVIPDNSQMKFYVRAPTYAEVQQTVPRVVSCFDAAAIATGCKHDIELMENPMLDIRQNKALGDEVANLYRHKYGPVTYDWGIKDASTDFGNITYELPSLHPSFAIPTEENGGNHTPAFTKAAATMDAHYACLNMSSALAAAGVRVVADDDFYTLVKSTFEEDKLLR